MTVSNIFQAQHEGDGPSEIEQELLNEIIRALRSIRYGSIVLTVHEGRLVEIQKTERIRSAGMKQQA
jgi:hypothetical protein